MFYTQNSPSNTRTLFGKKTWLGWLAFGFVIMVLGASAPRIFLTPDPDLKAPVSQEKASKSQGAVNPPGNKEIVVEPTSRSSTSTVSTSSMPSMTSTLIKLVIGIACLAVSCYFFARWQRKQGSQTGSQSLKLMKVVASQPVGRFGIVHLVVRGSQRVLIGIDASGVKTMVQLPPHPPEDLHEEAEIKVTPEQETIRQGLVETDAEAEMRQTIMKILQKQAA